MHRSENAFFFEYNLVRRSPARSDPKRGQREEGDQFYAADSDGVQGSESLPTGARSPWTISTVWNKDSTPQRDEPRVVRWERSN